MATRDTAGRPGLAWRAEQSRKAAEQRVDQSRKSVQQHAEAVGKDVKRAQKKAQAKDRATMDERRAEKKAAPVDRSWVPKVFVPLFLLGVLWLIVAGLMLGDAAYNNRKYGAVRKEAADAEAD